MSFIFSYITVIMLNSSSKIDKKELIYIALFNVIYFGINIALSIKFRMFVIIQIWICLIILMLIINKEKLQKFKIYETIFIVIFTVSLILSVTDRYDERGQNYIKRYLKNNDVETEMETSYTTIPDFAEAINYIKERDTGFYRIMKSPYYAINTSMWLKYNSIGGYFSIMPNTYQKMSRDLLNRQYYRLNFGIGEFDSRTKIGSILGEKYLIIKEKDTIPYGYSKLEEYNGESEIYVNNYNLPFGTLYTNYISKKEYENLTPLEKESSLLKTVVLEEKRNIEHMENFDYTDIIKEVKYEIIDESGIIIDDKTIKTTPEKYAIKLKVEETENCENYVCIKGLKYEPITANNKNQDINTAYTIGMELGDIVKFQETKDFASSAYYIENRRYII